jgi:hypothetical protein
MKVSLNYTLPASIFYSACNTLSLVILLLDTLPFPWNFGTHAKSIPVPVFFYVPSARTAYRKHSFSVVVWRKPHRKHVSHNRLRVEWFVSSTGRGADVIENTASSIAACLPCLQSCCLAKRFSNPLQYNAEFQLYTNYAREPE